MTIVYCTDTLYRSGGIESVLTQKANYLAEQLGYRIYIVTFHQKGRKPFFKLSEKVKLIDLDINIRFPFRQRRYMNWEPFLKKWAPTSAFHYAEWSSSLFRRWKRLVQKLLNSTSHIRAI